MKTTTKELSEKLTAALDAAGYEYETYFAHSSESCKVLPIFPLFSVIDFVPAFAMCELWQMLPNCITIKHDNYIKIMTGADVFYTDEYDDLLVNELYYPDKNPCDALAKLVLWCIENGHELNLKKKDQ